MPENHITWYNLRKETNTLAFQIWYGLFEPTIMQFGTTNAPTGSQGYINSTIQEALGDFASANLDDILIYSDLEEEHKEHVKWIMKSLFDGWLYLNPEQCKFHKETVKYLGLIISMKAMSMAEDKVETVKHWSQEETTKNTRLNNQFEV